MAGMAEISYHDATNYLVSNEIEMSCYGITI